MIYWIGYTLMVTGLCYLALMEWYRGLVLFISGAAMMLLGVKRDSSTSKETRR